MLDTSVLNDNDFVSTFHVFGPDQDYMRFFTGWISKWRADHPDSALFDASNAWKEFIIAFEKQSLTEEEYRFYEDLSKRLHIAAQNNRFCYTYGDIKRWHKLQRKMYEKLCITYEDELPIIMPFHKPKW